jgi:hypothetical protein
MRPEYDGNQTMTHGPSAAISRQPKELERTKGGAGWPKKILHHHPAPGGTIRSLKALQGLISCWPKMVATRGLSGEPEAASSISAHGAARPSRIASAPLATEHRTILISIPTSGRLQEDRPTSRSIPATTDRLSVSRATTAWASHSSHDNRTPADRG